MIRKSLFIVFSISLFACSPVSQAVPPASQEIVVTGPATPTATPLSTPTEISPTVTPRPTADPNFFRDEFSEILDVGWVWVREDPLNWSLKNIPGSLEINVGRGYVPAHNYANLLLRPAPEGNFQIEARITFKPTDNFQFAGLVVYQSDSNFTQAGRAFCNAVGCIGEGLYMNTYRRGVAVKPDLGYPYAESGPILLRLSRRGDTYTFEASADGEVWFSTGSHTSDMDPLQIGLVTGQRLGGSSLPAAFEYFEVRSLP